jgi:aryl carrier-like protein
VPPAAPKTSPDPASAPSPLRASPESETEAHVCTLFAELLDLPEVGRHDDFFSLGGDSINAARVLARLRADLGLDLSPITLFQHPTAAALAAHLDAHLDKDPDDLATLARAFATLSAEEQAALLSPPPPLAS